MAYTDAPYGFKPYGTILRKNLYPVNAAATVMFKYDLVKVSANGDVDACTAGDGQDILGSILACFDSNKVPTTYIADSATGYVLVADDPDQLYHAQEDSAGATIGLVDRWRNANLVSTHRGNTSTGLSKMELDSTMSNEHNAQLKIIDLYSSEEDLTHTQNRRWIVALNSRTFGGRVGASGV